MKKSSILFLTLCLSVIGYPALANPLHKTIEKETVLQTEMIETKDEAYQQAISILEELKESSSIELRQQLNVYSINLVNNSVGLLDGSYITTQEFLNEHGELFYKGFLKVKYQYVILDSNN